MSQQEKQPREEYRRTSFITTDPQLPPATRRLYLLRHAQSEPYSSHVPMDPELTEQGELQLKALQKHFFTQQLDAIVSSELQRARRTAQALQEMHPGAHFSIDPDFNEVHTVGNWRAYSLQDVHRLRAERMYRPDHTCPLGESPRQLYRRVSRAWERVTSGDARNIAVVTHYSVLGTLLSILFGATEDNEAAFAIVYPYAAISEVWIRDTREDPALPDSVAIIRYLCYSDHLKPHLVLS